MQNGAVEATREPFMTDMLIKLYSLPTPDQMTTSLSQQGIVIRRAMSYERRKVMEWVETTFNKGWSDECRVAFGRQPINCFIAIKDQLVCGFCCLDATYRNFVGPIGVSRELRGKGVGHALLLSCLNHMRVVGYAYAVVGDVGEPAFFQRAAGAREISDSTPGPYPQKLG